MALTTVLLASLGAGSSSHRLKIQSEEAETNGHFSSVQLPLACELSQVGLDVSPVSDRMIEALSA